MRKNYSLLLLFFIIASISSAQVFWTEDFGSACPSLCQLPYTGVNGTWNWVSTGTNGAAANTWFVSNTEQGLGRGACGTGTGSDASLHIGNVSSSPAASFFCPSGDCGAAYDASSGTPSDVTDARATSPVINCSGKTTITLAFNYIMGGEAGHDYCSIYYFDGTVWNNLGTPPITALCGVQGKWTHYSVPLPASANNNANVQIGFRWVNDANNSGNDPSFAVDSVTLSAPPSALPPKADFVAADSTICLGDSAYFIDKSLNGPTSWQWTFTGGSPSSSTKQDPAVYYSTAGTYTVKEVVKNVNGSDSLTKTSYIHVVAGPKVTITATKDTICAGQSTILKSTGGTTYYWSTPDTSKTTGPAVVDSIVVTPASTTTYTVGVNNGTCIKDTSIRIVVLPQPAATIKASADTVCAGYPDTITAGGGVSYLWNTGATTKSIVVNPTSSLGYTAFVSNGICDKAITFFVTVTPLPTITLNASKDTLCKGDSTLITATGGGTYLWSNGATTSSIKVAPGNTTQYKVLVTTKKCPNMDSITVVVDSVPVPTITPNDSICPGNPFKITATGGKTYQWSPSTGLSCDTCASPFATPPVTTTYTVTIANGPCKTTDSVKISLRQGPSGMAYQNTTIISGESANIYFTPDTTKGQTYVWVPNSTISCDTCPSTTVSPTVTTFYYIIVTDTTDKCSLRDSVLITVEPACGTIFMPNAFSPNGDGRNDILYVECNPRCIESMELIIYDRWGNKMFISNDPKIGWDGTYKGQPMNAGSYVYILHITDTKGAETKKNGTIELVR